MLNVSNLLLDFRITSHCDLGCDLCFRNPGILDSSKDKALAVIDKMYDVGLVLPAVNPLPAKIFLSLLSMQNKKAL